MTHEDEEVTRNFSSRVRVQAGGTLTGNPDALHVFVVREADLLARRSPVVDSTLFQTQAPPGTPASVRARRSFKACLFDRVGKALGALTILMIVLGVVALLWTSLVPQSEAEVVLVPQVRMVTLTHSVSEATSPGLLRLLAPIILTRSLTIATSGTAHVPARQAKGTIQFYNGAFFPLTIVRGQTITGRDGVVVVTDDPVVIPAARPTTPPTYGVTNVSAHALVPGAAGNIAAYDLNQACCATSVLAENLAPFTGGQDARTLRVVAPSDLESATQQLTPEVQQAVLAGLLNALHASEQLRRPPCQPSQWSSAGVGQEKSSVTVTLTLHCQAIAYRWTSVQSLATTWLTRLAAQQAGMLVRAVGTVRVKITSAAIVKASEARLTLTASGRFIPAWTTRDLRRLAASIAGHTTAQAAHQLLAQPGVQRVHIRVSASAGSILPEHVEQIHITIDLPPVPQTPEPNEPVHALYNRFDQYLV